MMLCAVLVSVMAAASVDIPDWAWVPAIALGIGALVALRWRRRWPVEIAVITGLVAIVAPPAGGPALLAFFSAAVRRPPRTALALLAFSIATVPPALLLYPDDETFWNGLLLAVMFCVATVAWGMFVHARRDLISSLEERAERAESEQHLRVEQARQSERARMAREMHDVLAHRISLVSMHAGALEFRPDAPPEEIERAAGVIRASAHQALDELREVIGVLREQEPDGDDRPEPPQPTAGDLPALVSETEAAGMRVRLTTGDVDLDHVPDLTGRTAYRVVQEGLTNARKHAPAAAVAVTVAGDREHGLSVEVRNPLSLARNGEAVPGAGTGLVGLVERTTLAGGRLEHGRTDGGDYRLAAWLPWQ